MAFDFPNAPAVGDITQSPSGSYRWDGVKWTASSQSSPVWLPIAGGTLTGPLFLSRDPIAFMEAATKQYVDLAGVVSFNTRKGNVVLTSGDVTTALGYTPYNVTNPAGYQTAAQVQAALGPYYTGSASDLRYTYKAGDTMTGTLILPQLQARANSYPRWNIWSLGAGADAKGTDCFADPSGNFYLQFVNDAFNDGRAFFTASRSGYAISGVNITAPTVTVTGALSVTSAATVSGNLTAANLYTGGEVHCTNVMATGGLFYIASGYYLQRQSDGAWRFVEGGTINSTLDTAGNLTVRAGVYGTYLHSTGDIRADSTLWAGGSGYNAWGSQIAGVLGGGAYWMGFNWDGTNVPAYANGAYACTLVSSTWVSNNFKNISAYTPNQNVDVSQSPTFGNVNCSNVVCSGGLFQIASGYYMQRSPSDGAWRFVENNTINCTIDTGGTISARMHMYCQEMHAGGNSFVPNICTSATMYPDNWSWFSSGGNLYQRMSGNADCLIGTFSDERGKQDIAPSKVDCLDLVRRIPLHEFRQRKMRLGLFSDADDDTELKPLGFIAQRVAEVFPSGVIGRDDTAPRRLDGSEAMVLKNIDANAMMAALVGAVQQLTARVAEIERIIT